MLPTAVVIKQRMACEVGYYPEGLKAERKDERNNVCASSIFWPSMWLLFRGRCPAGSAQFALPATKRLHRVSARGDLCRDGRDDFDFWGVIGEAIGGGRLLVCIIYY